MTSKWNALRDLGQSVWYDNVARPALDSGLLARLIAEDNVTGGTSNPSIFANAVLKSDLYDDEERMFDELKRAARCGHEVVLFQILSRDEIELPYRRDLAFTDLETGRTRPSHPCSRGGRALA